MTLEEKLSEIESGWEDYQGPFIGDAHRIIKALRLAIEQRKMELAEDYVPYVFGDARDQAILKILEEG